MWLQTIRCCAHLNTHEADATLILQTMRPTAEAIRHEMAHRAPPAREIAGDQRIICLLPNQEQWMSLGELRRYASQRSFAAMACQ